MQFEDVPFAITDLKNLEKSIIRKNPLMESGYGCKGLGKLDVKLM